MLSVDVITRTVEEFLPDLDQPTGEFLQRCFSQDLSVYSDRLAACGFSGLNRVLDAGCGFGQWSLCLSRMNAHVEAIDPSSERIILLKRLIASLGLDNLRARRMDLDGLDYPDGHFDGVFLFNVLTILPWRHALRELYRLLAPGGRIYVNAAGVGWQVHRWYTSHNATKGFSPRARIPKIFDKTWRYEQGLPVEAEGDLLIEPAELTAELNACGFVDVRLSGDGQTRVAGYAGPEPRRFYDGEYFGLPGVFEAVATKP
ncbi:class I SAM-dependent methyltransferase [Magnetospirillum moscoviense]|uniref:Methyltransferase domain-containing protein n=1 Tax=Magnetospirillum moscoviense TaxID=1437059 RepID=A0A178MW77_9PROT|nr:class I SAM-dependent methyltransferase [Magnetospirillum moscoviense]OAN55080.1 hypothetical protein A6A05_00530 [Magnetospirillum moscoviense]